jgi:hypothetical protein
MAANSNNLSAGGQGATGVAAAQGTAAAAGQAGASPAEAGLLPTSPTPSDGANSVGDMPTPEQIKRLGCFHILLALFLIYLLFKAWPPHDWPITSPEGKVPVVYGTDPIYFFKWLQPVLGWFKLPYPVAVWTTQDERLIFLVIVAGALGAYVHATTSFADYVGTRKLTTSWLWWYLLRPFVGIALALIFYFVVRAGFLTGGGNASEINPFGIATLAALAGMFSKQATDKLDEVFTTLFHPAPGKGDDKRGDKLSAPTIANIDPKEGPTTGDTLVTISGTGFESGITVTFDGTAATDVKVLNSTSITVKTPKHEAGPVTVEVTNSGNQKATVSGGYTYKVPPVTADGTASEIVTTTTTTTTKTGAGTEESDAQTANSKPDASAGGGPQPAPKISDISPDTGPAAGGVPVVISGSNFAPDATITFDDEELDKVDVVDASTITLMVPAHAAGPAKVVVLNPDGQSAESVFNYE